MSNTFNKAPPPVTPGAATPGTTPRAPGQGAPGQGAPGTRTPGTKAPGTPAPNARAPYARAICFAGIAVGLLTLTGCDQIDPLKRPYMWQASGVNDRNIALMAANPADLVRGRDAPQRGAIVETDGVTRLWTGKQLPLLSDVPGAGASSTTSTGGGGSGGSTPAAGGGS